MMKTRKDIVRLVVVSVIIVCYVFCITVPYLQTFGQSYVHENDFYSLTFMNIAIPDYPNCRLTLNGTVIDTSLSPLSNVISRIPLTEHTFDNLFRGATWTHSTGGETVDAKWLREHTKAAWLGFSFNWNYKTFTLQYILKLHNGDIVVCGSSPLFQKDGFSLGSANYFSPIGTALDFYLHIGD